MKFKLSKRYYGPFKFIERIGAVAYKLELPTDSKIHPVFHVALLKEYHGDTPLLLGAALEQVILSEIKPKAIVDHRLVNSDGQPTLEVLVEWMGTHRDEATWENLISLKEAFPHVNLEDKVAFEAKDIDINQQLDDMAVENNRAADITSNADVADREDNRRETKERDLQHNTRIKKTSY